MVPRAAHARRLHYPPETACCTGRLRIMVIPGGLGGQDVTGAEVVVELPVTPDTVTHEHPGDIRIVTRRSFGSSPVRVPRDKARGSIRAPRAPSRADQPQHSISRSGLQSNDQNLWMTGREYLPG